MNPLGSRISSPAHGISAGQPQAQASKPAGFLERLFGVRSGPPDPRNLVRAMAVPTRDPARLTFRFEVKSGFSTFDSSTLQSTKVNPGIFHDTMERLVERARNPTTSKVASTILVTVAAQRGFAGEQARKALNTLRSGLAHTNVFEDRRILEHLQIAEIALDRQQPAAKPPQKDKPAPHSAANPRSRESLRHSQHKWQGARGSALLGGGGAIVVGLATLPLGILVIAGGIGLLAFSKYCSRKIDALKAQLDPLGGKT